MALFTWCWIKSLSSVRWHSINFPQTHHPQHPEYCGPKQITCRQVYFCSVPTHALSQSLNTLAAQKMPLSELTPVRTTGSSRGSRQGNQGSWTDTYHLGWREVWKALLRGRGVLAGLPIGQQALLLRRCGQQKEKASVRGD